MRQEKLYAQSESLKAFDGAGGLFDVPDSPKSEDIGLRCILKNPQYLSDYDMFTIVRLQYDWRGELCYRIVGDTEEHKFGRCARFDEVSIVFAAERVPLDSGNWRLTVELGDLGAASIYAKIPYLDDARTYTGSYNVVRKMVGFIRWEYISVNGYNPIRVFRTKGKITYVIAAHFGMPATLLLTIQKLN